MNTGATRRASHVSILRVHTYTYLGATDCTLKLKVENKKRSKRIGFQDADTDANADAAEDENRD